MPPKIVRLQLESEDNGDFKYDIFCTDDNRVGCVAISLWPNQSMLYLTRIDIEKDHQKQGFGTAVLAALTKFCHRGILPVQQTAGSFGFWEKMRSRSGEHFRVGEEISATDWSILIRNTP